MRSYPRRSFLKTVGGLGTGLMLGSAANLLGCQTNSGKDANADFGLQLWTLRDVIGGDTRSVLTKVSSYGYKKIESFEGPKGIFWGMKNTEFKKLMDDLDMQIVASHTDINKDFERKAAEAAAIGMKYLICPWLGPQKSLDDYKKAADSFNQRGEICKKNGIRFAYHNHDYSFTEQDGQFPQDIFMKGTDKDLVDYEMDIYWVVTAGQDPVAWFNKYPGRFTMAHIKDRLKGIPATEKDASTVLGTGSIDFTDILKNGSHKGINYYIVEQERYDNLTSLEAVRLDADYMKKLKL